MPIRRFWLSGCQRPPWSATYVRRTSSQTGSESRITPSRSKITASTTPPFCPRSRKSGGLVARFVPPFFLDRRVWGRRLEGGVAAPPVPGERIDQTGGEPAGADDRFPESDAEHPPDDRDRVVKVRRGDLGRRGDAERAGPDQRQPRCVAGQQEVLLGHLDQPGRPDPRPTAAASRRGRAPAGSRAAPAGPDRPGPRGTRGWHPTTRPPSPRPATPVTWNRSGSTSASFSKKRARQPRPTSPYRAGASLVPVP